MIVDATNSNTALIASGYISQIALGFAQEVQRDRIERIAPQLIEVMPSVELAPRPWYNPGLSSRWFFVPGIIGSLTLVLVITLTAFAVVREREIGTLEQIMVTPIRPAEFILGKTLPFFLIGIFDVTLIAVVGSLWFQVPFRGHVWVLATGAVLFILCMLGVGLLISTVSSTQQQAMVTAFFFIMPAITFSGLRISHQHDAALDAAFQLCDSAALLSDRDSRHVSEGRGDGYSLAADGGDGRAGNRAADGGYFAIPQGAGLRIRRKLRGER